MSAPTPAGRVVVTHSRSFQALAMIRSLGSHGVEVIAADEYAVTPGALSRYTTGRFVYPSPSREPEAFIDALERNVVEHRPPAGVPYALLPVHHETFEIAKSRDRLSRHIDLPLAETAQFDLLSHKTRLWRFARDAGIAVPDAWFPRDVAELDALEGRIPFPAFVKIPNGASGIGVEKVHDGSELREAFEALSRDRAPEDLPFVQIAAPGEDYCTMVLCNRGKLVADLTYKNISVFPKNGGPGAIRETVMAPELTRAAEQLLQAADWHGVAQVDFRWTGDAADPPLTIEVNPRVCGGLFQAIASGADFPWLMFQLAVAGQAETPRSVEPGVRTKAPITGAISMLIEAATSTDEIEPLRSAWEQSKAAWGGGDAFGAVKRLFDGISESLDVAQRVERLRQILDENEETVSMLLDADDPLPALGLVYPVAVFLRHGRLDAKLLTATDA